jgi:hypothetical protein
VFSAEKIVENWEKTKKKRFFIKKTLQNQRENVIFST